MFAPGYWGKEYFGEEYWPPVTDEIVVPTPGGGGGITLPADEPLRSYADLIRIVYEDEEKVIKMMIRKFLEMQRDA